MFRLSFAKKPLKFIVISIVTLVLLLCTTQPSQLPSVVLIVPFLLIFGLFTAIIGLFAALRSGVFGRKQVKVGALGAALPTLLIVLQSVGQLTLRDTLTIVVLFGITFFYLAKRRAVV